MRIKVFAVLFAATGALAACGDTTAEQLLYGGAAGAGVSAVVNGNLVAGAAVGAAANYVYCNEFPRRC